MVNSRTRQSGFTLIEFMLASVITMAMLAATFTLMNNVFVANARISQVLITQQNVRVALNTITRDITMAGTGMPDGGTPIPNGGTAVALTRNGAGGTLPTPDDVINLLIPGDGSGPVVAKLSSTAVAVGTTSTTDVLTITMIDQTSPTWVTTSITSTGTVIDFSPEVRSGAGQLYVNDLLLFNNANGSAFGCVTKVSTSASQAEFMDGDVLNINQPAAAVNGTIKASLMNPGSSPATFPQATAVRATIITYYINNSNSSHPKLMRAVNGGTPQVMVEDIENLQFSYDLYNFENSTETSNQATTANPNQIRSVRVAISARSSERLQRTNDYYHFGLVSKVNVRNATFRNRYS